MNTMPSLKVQHESSEGQIGSEFLDVSCWRCDYMHIFYFRRDILISLNCITYKIKDLSLPFVGLVSIVLDTKFCVILRSCNFSSFP